MALELKVNPEYETLLPQISNEEYETLKMSFLTEGQHFPIIVNQDGVILDGHQRYRACNEIGMECRYEVKTFTNPLLEKKFVIEANLLRRHLSVAERAKLGYLLLAIETELGRQREEATLPKPGQKGFQPVVASGDATIDFGKAAEKVARKVGVSQATIERIKVIEERGTPEQIKAVEKGEEGILPTYKAIKDKEKAIEEKQEQKDRFKEILGSDEAAEEAVRRVKGEQYASRIDDVAVTIMSWGIPFIMAMGTDYWKQKIPVLTKMKEHLEWLISFDPDNQKEAVEVEYEVKING